MTDSLYALLCTIDESRLELFGQYRAEHYRFLIENKSKIVFGGPARVAEGGRPETMIIILHAASKSEAESFIASEPYNRYGGFKAVAVRPWSQVLPEPEPGFLQKTLDQELGQN